MAGLTVVMGKAITRDINNGSFEKLNTPEKKGEEDFEHTSCKRYTRIAS